MSAARPDSAVSLGERPNQRGIRRPAIDRGTQVMKDTSASGVSEVGCDLLSNQPQVVMIVDVEHLQIRTRRASVRERA